MEFWTAYLFVFLHFLSAIAWAGGAFFYNFVLFPGVSELSVDRQREVWLVLMHRLDRYLTIVFAGTVAFGMLAGIALGRYEEAIGLASRWGIAIAAAVLVAIIAFACGKASGSMAERILADDRYWSGETETVRQRDRVFARADRLDKIELALLPLAIALMALARFS